MTFATLTIKSDGTTLTDFSLSAPRELKIRLGEIAAEQKYGTIRWIGDTGSVQYNNEKVQIEIHRFLEWIEDWFLEELDTRPEIGVASVGEKGHPHYVFRRGPRESLR